MKLHAEELNFSSAAELPKYKGFKVIADVVVRLSMQPHLPGTGGDLYN